MIFDTDELSARKDDLTHLLNGYQALLANPFLTTEQRQALTKGVAKNELELASVNATLEAAQKLADIGYPDHKPEEVIAEIVAALKKLLADISLVMDDFKAPPLLADGGIIHAPEGAEGKEGIGLADSLPAKKSKTAK